ncbi:hypothetical protein [Streptococcus ruminicola]|uniref:hypothetical protein n=1 Tax=Streptococcus ruminicola TaxID=2686210 RepID=UPI002413EC81|nr:hypothetical protein [Streptococcus ruminicola]WFM81260.1 hypothetical protein P7Y79_06645 [Streptococcus ruminicola]
MGSLAIRAVDILLGYDIANLDDEQKSFFLSMYHEQLDDPDLTIPYDQIAGVVYENENSDENNEILFGNISLILSSYKGNSYENLEKNLRKIQNNYTLAQVQKEYIIKNSKNAQRLLLEQKCFSEDLDKKLKALDETTEKIGSDVDDIHDTKSSIYTDFIAILGVFSAFVFVLFGGIEVARAVFDIGDDLQTMDLSKMITISCLMLIGVLTLLYSLLLWIARITDKKIGYCMWKGCEEGCKHKGWHAPLRHSFYLALVAILGFISWCCH